MTLLYHNPVFQEHRTGGHPESPERLRAITRRLEESGLAQRCLPGPIRPATRGELEAVHAADHVTAVANFAAAGGGRMEADTVVSPQSYDVALQAAGSACQAVESVLAGQDLTALCLIRPPGHHALADAPMGFCLFNNVAVAAQYAIAQHRLERVLIVDWDVHHGNGTQDLFYDREDVHFLSIHRSPFYPGTGDEEETGTGQGLGATWNVPVAFGTSRKDYFRRLERTLADAAARCRPQLVLISAGFDAHRTDPIGSLGLESEDFSQLTRLILDVANAHCSGRVVSLLEGGYHTSSLAESVAIHLEELLSQGGVC